MGLTYDALFPGRFIKAGEMAGKPATLTIVDVYLDHLEGEDGREKPQAVVAFRETKREWALNKTNGQCLRALFGDDVDGWKGRQVTLYPERDSSGMSDSGVCLRVLGAPHLTKPLEVQIKLPRRKPIKRTLKPTGKTSTVDLDTGEVTDSEEPRIPAQVPESRADSVFAATDAEEAEEREIGESVEDIDLALGNVTPLHDGDSPATAKQLATIKAARKAANVNAAEFATIVNMNGGEATADGFGLTHEAAQFVIEALEAQS